VYVPAPKAFHKPPIIIYQGVAPPVHVYEKPAGSSYANAKSDNIVQLEGWNPSNGIPSNVIAAPVHHHAQARVDVLTSDDLSTSADSSGNWLSKSVVVGKSIGSAASSEKKSLGQPKAEARIDTSGEKEEELSDFESAVVRAKVSVASEQPQKEKLKKGIVEDIKIDA
jgi:hypothetical protein